LTAISHPKKEKESNVPSTNHPLGPLPLPLQRSALGNQLLDDFLFAGSQADVGEAVFVGDGLVGHAEEGEDEGDD
jgi:hypothetical protein